MINRFSILNILEIAPDDVCVDLNHSCCESSQMMLRVAIFLFALVCATGFNVIPTRSFAVSNQVAPGRNRADSWSIRA